jgi:hypothetical protein
MNTPHPYTKTERNTLNSIKAKLATNNATITTADNCNTLVILPNKRLHNKQQFSDFEHRPHATLPKTNQKNHQRQPHTNQQKQKMEIHKSKPVCPHIKWLDKTTQDRPTNKTSSKLAKRGSIQTGLAPITKNTRTLTPTIHIQY